MKTERPMTEAERRMEARGKASSEGKTLFKASYERAMAQLRAHPEILDIAAGLWDEAEDEGASD